MPKIEQLNWDKLKPKSQENKVYEPSTTNKQDKIYWRNKKPIQSEPTKHKPFFTCSKCGYEGSGRQDFKNHWLVEHD